MYLKALVENVSAGELQGRHGLALYVETKCHKLLFDVGPDKTLFQNAARCNIDLAEVDTVVISHGHNDHGGALAKFLRINEVAQVYVQESAFESHAAKLGPLRIPVGLKRSLMRHPRVHLVKGDVHIDEELSLFICKHEGEKGAVLHSNANDRLLERGAPDQFLHEQNLLIEGEKRILLMGCGHCGVASIVNAAPWVPDYVIGGFHLYDPVSRKQPDEMILESYAQWLQEHATTQFYTCHCTGTYAFDYLSKHAPNVHYLRCGDTLTLT